MDATFGSPRLEATPVETPARDAQMGKDGPINDRVDDHCVRLAALDASVR
jgi:hypothetical protein